MAVSILPTVVHFFSTNSYPNPNPNPNPNSNPNHGPPNPSPNPNPNANPNPNLVTRKICATHAQKLAELMNRYHNIIL